MIPCYRVKNLPNFTFKYMCESSITYSAGLLPFSSNQLLSNPHRKTCKSFSDMNHRSNPFLKSIFLWEFKILLLKKDKDVIIVRSSNIHIGFYQLSYELWTQKLALLSKNISKQRNRNIKYSKAVQRKNANHLIFIYSKRTLIFLNFRWNCFLKSQIDVRW